MDCIMLAYANRVGMVGEVGDGVSIASMIALLIRCLLRLPWWIVSASSMPVLIQCF